MLAFHHHNKIPDTNNLYRGKAYLGSWFRASVHSQLVSLLWACGEVGSHGKEHVTSRAMADQHRKRGRDEATVPSRTYSKNFPVLIRSLLLRFPPLPQSYLPEFGAPFWDDLTAQQLPQLVTAPLARSCLEIKQLSLNIQ